jgi:endonuclease/exonuclease/phosphatase family metal-dependent hydrolase
VLLKIATWNIGGGVLGESHQRGGSPSLDYYAAFLERHRPDVVCLQEAHDHDGRQEGQVQYLARRAGYPYSASFPTSASHLAPGASLALGIVSRFPITDAVYRKLPNPGLAAVGPNGERWQLHDKGYVVGQLDLGGRTLGLLNGHCFPLRHFGVSPTDPVFAPIWDQLTEDLLALAEAGPALAALDLNHTRISDLLGVVLRPGRYRNAFDDTPTTAKGRQNDYVLYGPTTRLLTSRVTASESDHSYCQASLLV